MGERTWSVTSWNKEVDLFMCFFLNRDINQVLENRSVLVFFRRALFIVRWFFLRSRPMIA